MTWSAPLAFLLRAGAASLGEDRGRTCGLLEQARRQFKEQRMGLYEMVAAYHLGQLQGGKEGARLEAEAHGWMRGQGIVRPARMAAMLAPGFWSLPAMATRHK